jgi:DNA polymerase I-like protein with 3'-5' exonuclease and polymerase domains
MRDPVQIPLIETESSWAPPSLLPDLTHATEIAVDLETRDPNLLQLGPGWATNDGEVVGVSIATNDWSGYLPFKHEGGGNLDKDFVLAWVKRQMSSPADKIFHNSLYDVGWLKREGIEIQGKIQDTMIAAPLINENRHRYSLDSLGFEYCGDRKDETLLKQAARDWGVNPKAEMWKLPSKYVGPYAEQDAVLTLKLWNKMKPVLEKQNLTKIYALESGILPLLIEMRWRGIKIDQDKAQKTMEQLKVKEEQTVKQIKKDYGYEIDLWAAASIAKVFEKNSLTYPRTERTNAPSFTAEWLEGHSHPLPQAIVKARRLNKLRTTFIEKMVFGHMRNGKIHGQINPLRSDGGGTVSGRFSYSSPNLQQVPARDPELGRLVRDLFIPDGQEYWGAFDYSQQEPRITVHYAALTKQLGAEEAVEAYQGQDADFHQIVADMAGIDRKKAKTINLGLSYGMGKQKLTQALDIPGPEAEALFAQYHRKVPFIKGLSNSCMRRASNKGFITTLLGRKCRFNMYEARNENSIPLSYEQAVEKWGKEDLVRAYTYKALNRLIQGSAADMTKQAMLNLWKEGYVPYVQVHDELDIGVSTRKEIEHIKEIMENCVILKVPNVVDAEIGTTWGKATKDYKEVLNERDQ